MRRAVVSTASVTALVAAALSGCGAPATSATSPSTAGIVLAAGQQVTTEAAPPATTSAPPRPSATTLVPAPAPVSTPVPTYATLPAPAPSASTVAPSPTTTAGDPCSVTWPGATAPGRIEVASGITCAQVKPVLAAYLAAVDDGTHGNTKALIVGGWACQSPTAADGAESGLAAECEQSGKRIAVRAR